MRNKSIPAEMFFNPVGASFSNRASIELRICLSTSIDTQRPPPPAKDSMRTIAKPHEPTLVRVFGHYGKTAGIAMSRASHD